MAQNMMYMICYLINDDVVELIYRKKKEYIQESPVTCLFIAIFTTSWARLELYELMSKHSDRILYCDTDSIFVVERPGDPTIQLGPYLGQLTDEVEKDHGPNEHIVEFICAGPKNYAYKVSNGATTVKVKGFSLNYENSQKINMNSMREMVMSMADNPSITMVNENKITREPRSRRIVNKREERKYQIVYDKRIIVEKGASTIPYGYTWDQQSEKEEPDVCEPLRLDLSEYYLFSQHHTPDIDNLGELFPFENTSLQDNERDIDLMATTDSDSELSDLPTVEDLEFLADSEDEEENGPSFYRAIDNE